MNETNNTNQSTRNNRSNYNNNDITSSANQMLEMIRTIIKQELNSNGLQTASSCELCSAIVEKVNSDGSVDVYFPPNDTNIFTRISNQTSFNLQVGDCVELTLKNGSFSNCWVSARHNTTSNSAFRKLESEKQETLNNFVETQSSQNEQILNSLQELQNNFNLLQADYANFKNSVNSTLQSIQQQINELKGS